MKLAEIDVFMYPVATHGTVAMFETPAHIDCLDDGNSRMDFC